jgi:hypothetical protein
MYKIFDTESNKPVIQENGGDIMNASFEEKSVWIQLFSMVVVLGTYFVRASGMLSRGITDLMAFVPLFLAAVMLLVAVLVAGHIVVAIAGRSEGSDERDRLIGWRAESHSSWILSVGVLAAITGLVMSVDPVWIAHLLLFSILLTDVAKYVFQIAYYRRGV